LAARRELRNSEAAIRHIAHALSVALSLLAVPAGAQLQLARIEGRVVDAQGQALEHVRVQLEDALGAVIRSRETDAAGQFAIADVAAGRYTLRATIPGIDPLLTPLVVDSSLPVNITLRMPLRVSGTVVVEASLAREAGSLNSVAGASIALAPVRVRQQGIQDVVATMPGWATEDNGLLHSRGVDDGFLYVIDGVPVYERLDQLFGLSPDLATVESVNVLTGYVPAEFGHKAGGVIDIRTREAAARWATAFDVEQASHASTGGSASAGGPIGELATIRMGAAGQRSGRFLDPVHPDNFHNRGQSISTFGQLSSASPSQNLLNASWGVGRMHFDVPNTDLQEMKGQDQRQRVRQAFANLSWQRAWSGRTASQVSGYVRRSDAELNGSAHDTPLFASADRSLVRAGAVASITMQRSEHLVKFGGEAQRLTLDEAFSFFVTSRRLARANGFGEAILDFDDDDPFEFAGRDVPSLFSLFVQDQWQIGSRVTLSSGLRFDRSTMLVARHQLSPRVGAAYRVSENTVARASVSRFLQPPQPENLLLSSSEEARVLSPFAEEGEEGGADVEPERQWGFEAGIERWIGRRVRVDVAAWHRTIREAADPNVFTGTTIIFPNAVAKGRASGVDLRIEMPKRRGWSAYANASAGKVVQRGPITGGLFLEDEIGELGEGEEFTPDHDQRVVLGGGITWMHERSGLTISLASRYESGTPIERGDEELDELLERPGADRVDFDRGRVKPRTLVSLIGDAPLWRSQHRSLRLRLSVLNLLDDDYAFNFGNPFSGTHFGAPRSFAISIRGEF
jgi:outer membrane receptor protein involved in Fe transport